MFTLWIRIRKTELKPRFLRCSMTAGRRPASSFCRVFTVFFALYIYRSVCPTSR